MKTVQEILNRIRWDEQYSKSDFKLAYYDRIDHNLIMIPFDDIQFFEGDHFSFYIIDNAGETRSVPFHRIKEIYKNDELIWQRKY